MGFYTLGGSRMHNVWGFPHIWLPEFKLLLRSSMSGSSLLGYLVELHHPVLLRLDMTYDLLWPIKCEHEWHFSFTGEDNELREVKMRDGQQQLNEAVTRISEIHRKTFQNHFFIINSVKL